MVTNNKRVIIYFNTSINSVFKILPLYEEVSKDLYRIDDLSAYIKSLIFEFDGLEQTISMGFSYEYISLLATLNSLKEEIHVDGDRKSTVRREVFKCINIIKNMVAKLEEGA